MLEALTHWDYRCFQLLYEGQIGVFEPLMRLLSAKAFWIPLYLFIIQQTLLKYGRQAWIPLLVLIILVILADQLTSSFMKPYFERLRPCRDPLLQAVEFVRGCGGRYGFASSHAANTMALAVFVNFLFQSKWARWIILWSAAVGYSRIFLGVHFPLDVLAGMGVGALLAAMGWVTTKQLLQTHLPSFQ